MEGHFSPRAHATWGIKPPWLLPRRCYGHRVDESRSTGAFVFNEPAAVADAQSGEQFVKGLTLHTAVQHLPRVIGGVTWEAMIAKLPEDTRDVLAAVDINQWYPEYHLERMMHLLFEDIALGDREHFLDIVRGLSKAGVSRFFRLLINLSSGRFVLRKIPVLWDRVRKGPARLRSECTDDGRVLIHYENYKYASDPLYRLLSVANIQAVVEAATRKIPTWELVAHGPDSMTLAFTIPGKEDLALSGSDPAELH